MRKYKYQWEISKEAKYKLILEQKSSICLLEILLNSYNWEVQKFSVPKCKLNILKKIIEPYSEIHSTFWQNLTDWILSMSWFKLMGIFENDSIYQKY